MKIVLMIMLVLMAFCITASARPVAVGGDFGRAWISNYLASNPGPVSQSNNSSSENWGNSPKVQGTIGSEMLSRQNTTNTIKPGTNWLGDATNLVNPTIPQNFTQVPFLIMGGQRPVHAIDASWNHTAQILQPDANGLIHGWDAETYDAVGPALDYL